MLLSLTTMPGLDTRMSAALLHGQASFSPVITGSSSGDSAAWRFACWGYPVPVFRCPLSSQLMQAIMSDAHPTAH